MNLLEPFHYDFLQRAFLAGILLSIVAPFLGTFLVVRGYALFADALSHISLLGIAASLAFGVPTMVGAMIASVVASLGMERLRSTGRVMNESAIALFLSGSLAIAIVIMSLSRGSIGNIVSYLFGSLTTVSFESVVIFSVLSIVAIVFLISFFRELFLLSLDEELARTSGIRVEFVNYAFIVIAALIAASALQIVGVLLVGSLMVIPVLSALQFTRGFRGTVVIAVVFSVIAFLIGFFASYEFNLPSGGAIVLASIFLFLVSLGIGGLWNRIRISQ